MKLPVFVLLLAALSLAGCQKKEEASAAGLDALTKLTQKARYVGVGLYQPGRMWAQLVRAQAPAAAADAVLKDDETVIVVLDSVTGELRQCGNLSGYCTHMNPWGARAVAAQLTRHAEDLDAEQAAANAAAEARLRKSLVRRHSG